MDLEERSFQNNLPKWEDPSLLDYDTRIEPSFSEFTQARQDRDFPISEVLQINSKPQDWDPRAMLNNLSFLEQKIHHLQNLVHLIVGRRGLGRSDELVVQQQQLITADLTSIIVQLISTAGSLLPSVKHNLSSFSTPQLEQLGQPGGILSNSGTAGLTASAMPQSNGGSKVLEQSNPVGHPSVIGDNDHNFSMEEHEVKDEDDAEEGENLPPGSYEILQLEKEEILAPHTHFCTICGKGFKRDANLRMHMRGHGDEYKTPEALAKPNKGNSSEATLLKRYSCPYAGCKRNKDHKKFQPLKTILCVKNHYKRTHCDKSYICSRCNTKKFSVIADLKTHEKHCGRDKWLCSCGTTFSRKDKLFGHIALFQGHTPAIPLDETRGTGKLSSEQEVNGETTNTKVTSINFGFSSGSRSGSVVQDVMYAKGNAVDDPSGYFSPMNFDSSNFSGFNDFSRAAFDDSDSGFSFFVQESCTFMQKNGGESSSSNLE